MLRNFLDNYSTVKQIPLVPRHISNPHIIKEKNRTYETGKPLTLTFQARQQTLDNKGDKTEPKKHGER